MPNYWCDIDHQPRVLCDKDKEGNCLRVIEYLEGPDPDVPPALHIQVSLQDRRRADAQAGVVGTDRGDFISGT